MSLQSKDVSHWLGAKLESALYCVHGSSVVSICVKSQNSVTYWTMTDLVPAGLLVYWTMTVTWFQQACLSSTQVSFFSLGKFLSCLWQVEIHVGYSYHISISLYFGFFVHFFTVICYSLLGVNQLAYWVDTWVWPTCQCQFLLGALSTCHFCLEINLLSFTALWI